MQAMNGILDYFSATNVSGNFYLNLPTFTAGYRTDLHPILAHKCTKARQRIGIR
jgi:hypothetical protein